MSTFVLTNAFINYEGRDITGFLNQIALTFENELQDDTAFGDTFKTRIGGMFTAGMDMTGYWDHVDEVGPPIDSLDKDLFEKVGSANTALLGVSGEGATLGDVGFFMDVNQANYNPGATLGEIYAFSINCQGNGRLHRGSVMEKQTLSATANGTARQVGAVSVTQTIYSAIFVTSVSGTSPTLDVTIESDDDSGFASAVLRMTHPQIIAVGANKQSLAGAVTDDWWRMVFTIGGTDTPTFKVFGLLAISSHTIP